MVEYARLEAFSLALVEQLRARGVACVITSGMACVEYGISLATKDCDLLCEPAGAATLLELLAATPLNGQPPSYRGNLSPPLDERWLRGGWTSHFVWNEEVYLDVFGLAPRVEVPWHASVAGAYAGLHVVAQMKKSSRLKDWDPATALGLKMLRAGDERGWLHIFDPELLLTLRRETQCPPEVLARRPALGVADTLLPAMVNAERLYWQELDRLRLAAYERALRPYLEAVRRAGIRGAPLLESHRVRVDCAEEHLVTRPLEPEALFTEARAAVALAVNPALLQYLPDLRENFRIPS